MKFQLLVSDIHSKARAGLLTTDHGDIPTPVFMPVGTLGSVKAVQQRELESDIDAKIILGNAYHLYLRVGVDFLEQAGGLHSFIHWNRPILTDSGGYQIYSLAKNCKITHDGAVFKSHIDGKKYTFTPEGVIDMQRSMGSDIMMAFDECIPYPYHYEYAKKSLSMTHQWLQRCVMRFKETPSKYKHNQALFAIVQGGMFTDLRDQSAEFVAMQNLPGYAIGGLSVGEPHSMMYSLTERICTILPQKKPRYLMGVGTPENMLECIALGVDMFDCVMPTRNARNGMLFTTHGIINIRNVKWKNDFNAIDSQLGGYVSTHYSKAYLRHLMMSKELLGLQIASIHNLTFYLWLMKQARHKIIEGCFSVWKKEIINTVSKRL